MGPLDRYAFRVIVSIALHFTTAVVAGVSAALVAEPQPAIAALLGGVVAVNVLLGLRLHVRLMRHLQGHQIH